jgi:Holliday junction resolvase RusA-like endonuclease
MKLIIPLQPMPSPRPRLGKNRTYMPSKYVAWKEAAAVSIRNQLPLGWQAISSACVVDLVFVMPRIKKKRADWITPIDGRQAHIVRPDMDNLMKSVFDAMTEASFWRDDCQYYRGHSCKYYAAVGEEPHIDIDVIWF